MSDIEEIPFVEWLADQQSLDEWRAAQLAPSEARDFSALLEHLDSILRFLAGTDGTMLQFGVRTWVLLYAVRPDLVEWESFDSAASRFGVDRIKLKRALEALESDIPTFRVVRRHHANAALQRRRLTLREKARSDNRRASLQRQGAFFLVRGSGAERAPVSPDGVPPGVAVVTPRDREPVVGDGLSAGSHCLA